MIDPQDYRKLIMASVDQVKAANDETAAALTAAKAQAEALGVDFETLKGKYDGLAADVAAVIAPLNTVKALLPQKVKDFITKYTAN